MRARSITTLSSGLQPQPELAGQESTTIRVKTAANNSNMLIDKDRVSVGVGGDETGGARGALVGLG